MFATSANLPTKGHMIDFLSTWPSTWHWKSTKNPPKRLPKSRKIYKKRDHILYVVFDWFFIDFGSLLGGFLVDFQCQVEGQVDKKSIIWPVVGKLAEVAKMPQNYCKNQYFWLSRPSNFEAKFNKKRTQTDQNSSKNLVSILIQFLMDFGGQLGSKILPKPGQNRWKIDERWTSKSMKIFYAFWMGS